MIPLQVGYVKRKFSYYSPTSDIDFSKVSASDFVSLSGDLVYKQLVDVVLPYQVIIPLVYLFMAHQEPGDLHLRMQPFIMVKWKKR